MDLILRAIAGSILMGAGFFCGMLFMREQYMRVLEDLQTGKGDRNKSSF